ncbi:MerR family DNA-binding transcriptional regulator [Streptomyces sp. NPDC000880]
MTGLRSLPSVSQSLTRTPWRTGASRRSIRYYEQQGLPEARRTGKGWRVYDEWAVHDPHATQRPRGSRASLGDDVLRSW